jgi:hypothetical protein
LGIVVVGSLLVLYIQYKPTIDQLLEGNAFKKQNATDQLQRDVYNALYPNSTLSYDEAKKSLETPQSVLEWRKWRDQQYLERKGLLNTTQEQENKE